MARGPLYLVVNITLYAPEQDEAIQFSSHVFLVKPRVHPGDCGIPQLNRKSASHNYFVLLRDL